MSKSTSIFNWYILIVSAPFLFILATCIFLLQIRTMRKIEKKPLVDNRNNWDANIVVKADNFHPYNLALSKEGIIYATDQKAGCVWMWNSVSSGLSPIVEGLRKPRSIALDNVGKTWVVDHDQVMSIAPNGTERWLSLPAQLGRIDDLTFDPYRHSFIVLGRRKIFSVDKDEQWQVIHKDKPWIHGMAWELAPGEEGELFLIDYQFCIMKILTDGTKSKSQPKGSVIFAGDLAFHPKIGLIIVDTHSRHKRVLRMPISGNQFELIYKCDRNSEIRHPTGVAIGPDERIYVCDSKVGAVIVLQRKLVN